MYIPFIVYCLCSYTTLYVSSCRLWYSELQSGYLMRPIGLID